MSDTMNMSKYMDLFLTEAREHLSNIEEDLAQLEERPDDARTLDELFRHAHSLKGMAASMGYPAVATLAHGIEDVLDRIKRRNVLFGPSVKGVLMGAFDSVERMIAEIAKGKEPALDIEPWLLALRGLARASGPEDAPPAGNRSHGASLLPAPHPSAGRRLLHLEVVFSGDCPLPAARAAVTLKRLERRGQVIHCVPGPAELGQGAFDGTLRLVIETADPPESLRSDLLGMEDVRSVHLTMPQTRAESPATLEGPAHPHPGGGRVAARDEADLPSRPDAPPDAHHPFWNGADPPPRGAEPARAATAARGPLGATLPPSEDAPGGAAEPPRGAEPEDREPPRIRSTSLSPASSPVISSAPLPHADSSLSTVRIPASSLDRFLDTIGELIVQRGRISGLLENTADRALTLSLERLKGLVERLYSDVMALRLLPFESIAQRFIRSVREMAASQDKRATLKITGREVLLDRSMLDELTDPINHMLRNAIDHGLERPADRRAAGKPEAGTIAIALERSGDSVTIRIADDGRGMDPARIKWAALAKGFITRETFDCISDADALMLTTIPGFSTAEKVTGLSGRGVGMDVVRTRVETLGGRLTLRSKPGAGVTVEMRLPLTIVVVQAFLVEAGRRTWAVPLSSVEKTFEVTPEMVDEAGEQLSVTTGNGRAPLFDLARRLGLPADERPVSPRRPALLSSDANRSVAFTVDRIIGRREIVVKPLRQPLEELRGFSGAAILDDGSIALILDLFSLGRF